MMAYMKKLVGKVVDKLQEFALAQRTRLLCVADSVAGRDILSVRHGRPIRVAKGETTNIGVYYLAIVALSKQAETII